MTGACGRSRWAILSFLLLCAFASAQVPTAEVVLSLSGGGVLPGGGVDDEELVRVAVSQAPRRFLNDQTLAFYLGDLDGDGLMDEPNDIDALELVPVTPGVPMTAGVYFSLISDQSGMKDGDILRFSPGGSAGTVETVHAESFLINALAANDGNIDVDAIAFQPNGDLLFSLAEDELTGPSKILIEDESILILPAGSAQASVFLPGVQVENMAQVAMAKTDVIGDVKGLEFVGGEVLFTVQSPSAHDATIFSTAAGGSIYGGLVEAALGFGNQVEADALAIHQGDPFPCVDLDLIQAKGGDPLVATVTGATAGQPVLFIVSSVGIPAGQGMAVPGFGVLALDDTDPLFLSGAQNAPALIAVADVEGTAVFTDAAPKVGLVPYDVAIQVLDTSSGRISNPILLEVNQ